MQIQVLFFGEDLGEASLIMKTSNLFTLDLRDAGKGLIVAMGGAVISAMETTFNAGSFTFNWRQIGLTALAAGLAYLGKNFFTSAKIVKDGPGN